MARRLVAACLLTACVLALTSAGTEAEAPRTYEIGDNWVYNIEMDMEDLDLEGTYVVTVDALSTTTVAGVAYDTYTIGFDGSLDLSGEIEGVTVEGSAEYSAMVFVDVETLDDVKQDLNLSMDVEMEFLGIPIELSMWEHTVTTYSPPGGIGEEPEDPEEGDSWTMTCTEHTDSTSYDGISITSDSGSATVTMSYLCVGKETVVTPAGTFECDVTQKDDGDSIQTTWYSDVVGNDVKIVIDSDSDTSVTYLLASYQYIPDEEDEDSSVLYIALGAVAAVVVVIVVVALVLMKRRKPITPQPMQPVPAPPSEIPPPGPPGTPPGPQ